MTIHVSISEAKARLSRFVDRAVEENEKIIIESHGNPRAVLIPYSDYEQFCTWQETQRRQQALEELRQLTRQIRARNPDLSPEAGEALADRYTRDVIEEMVAEGKVEYDSGKP
jgi:prevent-host-death family protein